MEQIIKKTIGSTVHTFVVSGKNLFDVVMESQKLSFPDVKCCGLCGSTDLTLGAHKGKDDKGNEVYDYVDIKCNNFDCRASLTFGQTKKDPNTFYLRTNDKREYDWKPFVKETPAQPPAQKQSQPAGKSSQHTSAPKQPDAPAKPSGKAVHFGTKISTAKTPEDLKKLCEQVKTIPGLNDVDKLYLNGECLRKRNLFNALPLS